MIELLKCITKNNICHKEKPLQSADIIKTQKSLILQGCPFLPVDFLSFLKHFNGVKASDSAILGIAPLEDDSLNIVEFNARFNFAENKAILGYDDSTFLIYDNTDNRYKLVDRYDMIVLDVFSDNELVYAINSILHL